MTNVNQYPALLDADRAIVLLREVVAEYGADHTYEKPDGTLVCRYIHNDTEYGCIVAKVLGRHGVPAETLTRYEGLNAGQLGDHSLNIRGLQPLLTVAASRVLHVAQIRQDGFFTWGSALADAEREYAELTRGVAA